MKELTTYYVYRHIRLDNNTVFYVGKGTRGRAWAKTRRNAHWKNIVAQTPYRIEFLFIGLTNDQSIEKEKEFISIYKRVSDGGTLCNIEMSGEAGRESFKRTGTIPDVAKRNAKGLSEEAKNKCSRNRQRVSFTAVSPDGIEEFFEGGRDMCLKYNIPFFSTNIRGCLRKPLTKTYHGWSNFRYGSPESVNNAA